MSELHKFLFDGLPVRGMIVRLSDAWVEILKRRRAADAADQWPWPVAEMLGEMAAAGALIGIQAVVLNNAKIGRNCVVGAGAVVTEGKEFPDNSLIVGAPAKAIRTLDEAAIAGFAQLAPHYVENAKLHGSRLKKIG